MSRRPSFVHLRIVVALVALMVALPLALLASVPTSADYFPAPVAGEKCPAWLHDRYVTTGPDGLQYATWHPIVDEQFGCGYDHEHGSDPRLFGDGTWMPAFGYVGANGHHSESHFGHKLMAFERVATSPSGQNLGTYQFMYHMHMGSTVQSRACVQYHEVNLVVADPSGAIVVDLHFLGDFGEARNNIDQAKIPLSSCAGIANPRGYQTVIENGVEVISFGGVGERHISTFDTDGSNVGYEPWILNYKNIEPLLGAHVFGLSVNVHSSVTACTTKTCAAVRNLNDPGERHGAMRSVVATSNDRFHFGFADVQNDADGHFTTNEFGDGPGTMPQYVKPGLAIEFRSMGRVYPKVPQDGWYASYDQLPFNRGLMNPLRLLAAN